MQTKIQKLNTQISEINNLLNLSYNSPELSAWEAKTERVLMYIFGENSLNIKSFKNIRYSPGVYYSGMPKSDYIEAYSKGLLRAKLLLEGMLDEISEEDIDIKVEEFDFWLCIDIRISHVSRKLFEDGYYANSTLEAMILLNNTIKQELISLGIGEFDGASLMDRAFSPNNPIIRFSDTTTQTGKDIQQGYMFLYKGAMVAIRNPKSHENITINKQQAMHYISLANMLLLKLSERI